MSRTGVVVVTWNSASTIQACLESCAGLPVVVVDNASADDTVARTAGHANVRVISNTENRGFAAAANQGIAALNTPNILLLNPDAQLVCGLNVLESELSDPGIGIATGNLRHSRGGTQTGFNVRRFPTAMTLVFETLGLNLLVPSNSVNRRYRCLDVDLSKRASVEQPAGAFVVFRRNLWAEVGGFDERFRPLWFEDVDFCKRVYDHGYLAVYNPAAVVLHQGGSSAALLSREFRREYWYVSLLRYASKHYRRKEALAVAAAVVFVSVVRLIPDMAATRSFRPFSVLRSLVRTAKECVLPARLPVRPRSIPPARATAR